ncbi:hypothetical protein J6P92_08170 [bacterium]|nr:hypothetical protein [bacterium]
MAIQGFDYKDFAQNLAQQAYELLPPDFNDDQKNYVANTLLNFSAVAGEALANDTQLNFNLDQAVMITQIIAEWSFHKSVDLIRSGIPRQYWDPIMQKIAYTIFEIAKNAFHLNLPQDQCLQVIEHHVKKTYVDCIVELKDKNLIDDELMQFAANQSNIDQMAQQQVEMEQAQIEEQAQIQAEQGYTEAQPLPQVEQVPVVQQQQQVPAEPQKDYKVLKLATLAMLFNRMRQEKVQTYLDKFNNRDADTVLRLMNVEHLDSKMDPKAIMQYLNEISENLPGGGINVDMAKEAVVERIRNVSQYFDKSQLEQNLRLERNKVRRFIFTAMEGEYLEIPPRVANIIATHLEDSV